MTIPSPTRRAGPWWTLAVLCAGQAMVFVDVSIVNVAMPTIGGDLGIGAGQLQYLVTAYGATLGGLLILGGRLADLLGHRRVLVIGTAIFVLASVLAGSSVLPLMLIAARVAQGAGAALLSPSALAVLNTVFPEGRDRARAFGIWGALGGLGAVAGVVFGGVLTQTLGWQAIFLINAPIGVLVLAGVRYAVQPDGPTGRRRGLDVAGGALVAAGLLALCFGFGDLGAAAGPTAPGLSLVAAGVVLLAAAVVVERRAAHPIVPYHALTRPGVRPILALTVLAFGTLLTLFFFASLYLNRVLGLTPARTGLAYLPIAVSVVIGSIAGSRLIDRWGTSRVRIVAFVLSATGTAAIAIAAPVASYDVSLLPGFVVAGLGIGSSFVALQIGIMRGVPDGQAGVLGGLFGTCQEAGGALVLAIATLTVFGTRPATADALRLGFAVSCVFALLALVAATAMATRSAVAAAGS